MNSWTSFLFALGLIYIFIKKKFRKTLILIRKVPLGTRIGIIVGLLYLLINLYLIGTIFTAKHKIETLQEILSQVENTLTQVEEETTKRFTHHEIRNFQAVGRIAVLENSIDKETKRWAKVKQIRSAIQGIVAVPLPVEEATEIASVVIDNSDQYDVPISLILAIIRAESNFNSKAISSTNAQGIMQVLPSTAEEIKLWLGVKYYNSWRPRHNIQFGTVYLARMLHMFGDKEELAIKAYNCGPTCVEKVEGGVWSAYPKETQEYITKVLEWKNKINNLGIR